MSRTIWKYSLWEGGMRDAVTLQMPRGAALLCAREQYDQPCVWAEVDPDAPLEERRLEVYGTGHPVRPFWIYLGTAMCHGGRLVWHVYAEPYVFRGQEVRNG